MASYSPQNTFWVRNFLFYAKVVMSYGYSHISEPPGWSILHRTNTKKYRRIEVSPMGLWALQFFGKCKANSAHSGTPKSLLWEKLKFGSIRPITPMKISPFLSFKINPRELRDLRRRTEAMPVKDTHQNKTVAFGQRPRPLHNRYTRTGACFPTFPLGNGRWRSLRNPKRLRNGRFTSEISVEASRKLYTQ